MSSTRRLFRRNPLPNCPHGTISGYTNWVCRCDECYAVARRYRRRAYVARRQRQAAAARGES